MSSDLLQIASSGARAARAALDVTAQNIANAGTEGYVRRTMTVAEMAGSNFASSIGDVSLFGAGPAQIKRNADVFRQAETRRTASDAARADAQVTGLENLSNAVEQSNVFPAITAFESSLQQLASNPNDPSLRASAMEAARTMSQSFNIAGTSLDAVGQQLQFEATDGVNQVNQLAQNLASLNNKIATDTDPAMNQSVLLDQRDAILQKLASFGDVTTTIAIDNTVKVQMGGASGPVLVQGGNANALAMTTAANGTISFTLGGAPLTLGGGALAGKAQALTTYANAVSRLDGIASALATAANTTQAGGVALDGTAGVAMFSGTTAKTLTMVLSSGSQIATAPAGAGANSRNSANLTALQTALNNAGVSSGTDSLLFDLSASVQGATTTRDALDAIAANAKTAMEASSGVNLDDEAANLLRFQQAFQASGKVIQVASTLFDTLLNIH
ncbi:MAG: flagellar hook-associated protein FlgK [Sphingomonadales bacterium]|nr:flagellar hook-associated protein FlgK [Sphingomonadales bacterium]